ncbi:glycogen synthase GlgA [Vibrio crassostreae]|uniref:glycogen synthase GlgA n=1 Tax=Vibrio crassostreae TaxID=246167 RepID=UPI001B30EF8B|nr:glycogen synthase GlgA [Vibrio crassostreae]
MVTKNLSILFVATEVDGLIKSGGLADVAKALPKALQALKQDVSVVIPAYSKIANIESAEVILSTQLEHWPHTAYQVKTLNFDGLNVLGVECQQYFGRSEMYAENNQAYADNGERFAFFSAACLDMLPKLGTQPDIIHANDWHTGLVPFLLKSRYREHGFYKKMRSVITIHNAVFKGVFSYDELQCLPEMHSCHSKISAVSDSHVSMLKAGVLSADKISTVSPTYAEELKTELGSHGMAHEFQHRSQDLWGILNGCNYDDWSPEVDPYLPRKYKSTKHSLSCGKSACKKKLQQDVGLPQADCAVYGMVCRLTNQKGIHYLLPIINEFLKNDLQIVVVGTGEPALSSQLRELSKINADKFAFVEAYNNELAHLVEAGSDFFLMPSEFEPCGLNQIYSMAYGTLPIVRSVGGLKDTVHHYDDNPEVATGFAFEQPTPQALLTVLHRSLLLYTQNPNEIKRVQLHAMKQRFTWESAARSYLKMYRTTFEGACC